MNGIVRRIARLLSVKGRDPVPSKRLAKWVGPGDFEATGREFLRYFIDLAELKPDEAVLDVGCGCGRMAVPLTRYLSGEAVYEGFDVIPDLIKWCERNVTRRYPNFCFRLADIYNKVYNPGGKQMSYEYEFPYESRSFDFVFLTSVFTHMLPMDMERYLSEIARVLRPGGRSLVTYFLLNDESRELIAAGSSSLDFKHSFEGCMTLSSDAPETAVAYDEADALGLYAKNALEVVRPVHYGSWCGRANGLSFQDIVMANRPG